MTRRRTPSQAGFTLMELAVVITIVGFLLGSLMYTFSAQVDQRNRDDTRRRLEQAKELILSYAIVNGRLPCPARYASSSSNSGGLESFCTAASGTCSGSETTTVQTHGNCSNYYDGYVPASTIGMTSIDASGFALDAWGNRIRYAVAQTNTQCTVTGPTAGLFTSTSNLKTYGVGCQPNDLLICKTYSDASLGTVTATTCGGTANQLMSQSLVVAIVFSTGKNGGTTTTFGNDESVNLKTTFGATSPTFVFHPPTENTATNGEFDDQFTWVVVGELYGKLVGAGVLP